MKFAIISAGEGSRLSNEGVKLPKPLVRLNGEAMIERLVRIFMKAGAESVVIIINNEVQQTKDFMQQLKKKYPIELVVKTTPSSMHSFFELSPLLGTEDFCLTTVDTIFREKDFFDYIDCFRHCDADGLMAVTDFVDDEKPLYIAADGNMDIKAFRDNPEDDCNFISGGIYCLRANSLVTLRRCMDSGVSRMRNFQRELLADGLKLKAYKFSKILDVDHASDIEKAEAFLKS